MHHLVTGTTGGLGGYTLELLKKMVLQSEIYVLVRSEEKGGALKEAGFNIRTDDYDDLDSIKEALRGINQLLLVSGAPGDHQAEHKSIVKAAQTAGVSYITCTSFADAGHPVSVLAPDHRFTEKMIKDSGISHTFLRNNWYAGNELPITGQTLRAGQFVYIAGNGKTGWTLKRGYAEAATRVLIEGDSPEILGLSDNLTDYEELVKVLEHATGKELEIIGANDTTFVENLGEAGFPQETADVFLATQHDIKKDRLAISFDDLEKVLGRPLTSLGAALKEIPDQK